MIIGLCMARHANVFSYGVQTFKLIFLLAKKILEMLAKGEVLLHCFGFFSWNPNHSFSYSKCEVGYSVMNKSEYKSETII